MIAECATLLIYMAVLLVLGALFARYNKDLSDFVRGGAIGTGVEQHSAGIGVLLAPFSAALQLYALAAFTSTTLNLPLVSVLIAIGTVVIFYSTTGGKWAVMATDFVQASVLLSITILVFILSLKAIGGIGEFVHLYSSPAFHNDYIFFKQPGEFPGDCFIVKWAIMAFLAQISLQAATRYITAKDGLVASRSAWLGVVLMAIGSLIWFVSPIITYALMFASQDTIALFEAYLLIASIIGIPHLVGLWIKKLPKWSYLPILISCLIPSVWSIIDQSINGTIWSIQGRAMRIFIFGMVATAISWLLRNWSSAKSREDIKDFFKTMTTPVDYKQYFVMSKAVGVVSLLMLGIVLFPNTLFHRLCILVVAASIFLVAGLLRFQGHRTHRECLASQPQEPESKEYLPESELSKERV